MSIAPAAWRGAVATPFRWLSKLVGPAIVTVAGIVLGYQYWLPNKRVVPVAVALLLLGLSWQIGMVSGLGLLTVMLPYPRGTVFGNTNLAMILILLVVWLLRMTQRMSPLPIRTPSDGPIVCLVIAYIVSFYNVRPGVFGTRAVENFELLLSQILMFYLIVNNVRRSQDLERFHVFQVVGALSVFLISVYELNNPAAPFIRGWLDFTNTTGTEFNTRNIRVGASFHDFELLSEYCALMLVLLAFLVVRARSNTRRVVFIGMFLFNAFVLFTTVTRGAIIALAIGILYLLWLVRRRLKFVPFVSVVAGILVLAIGMNFFVSHYTKSGDLFARLFETKIVNGWMPEDRAEVWTIAWQRALVHPLIGQGPYYVPIPGYVYAWPHNNYLFTANIIGFIGLGFFLWLLWTFLRITRPVTDDLRDPDYARAYLTIAHIQVIVFLINEFKIEYLRNNIYEFMVWLNYATWCAGGLIVRQPLRAAAPAPSRVLEPTPAPLSAPLPARARWRGAQPT
jgi:O-antigen ligase